MREYVMGARIQLNDAFSSVMRGVVRSTNQLRERMGTADRSTLRWRDSAGRLRNELGQYVGEANRAARASGTLGSSVGGLTSRFGALNGMVAAVAGGMAIKGGYDWLISSNADMETYQNTLAVVMKSQEKANKTLEWANQFAKETPFEIPQIVEATTRMTSYGINAEKTLGTVGDMASVMGKDLMQAVEAVADAQTGELERLKEFGITKKMLEEQAKLMGATPFDSKGSLKDQTALNAALFAIMEDRYKGGMELQSKTFKGLTSNLSDTIGTMGRQLGKPLFEKAKKGLQDFLGWLDRLQKSGAMDRFIQGAQQMGAKVGKVFSAIGRFVKDVIGGIASRFTQFYTENKPKIDQVGEALRIAFQNVTTFAKPILSWLKDVAVPGLVDWLAKAGGWVLDIALWFRNNWTWIAPMIVGLTAAWAGYYAVTKTIQAATKIWTGVQWALNVAMNANPIGLIITGIGLLIGVVILLVQHWDKVKAAGTALWEAMKNIWNAGITWVSQQVSKAWEWGWNFITGIGDGIMRAKDWLISKIESVFQAVRDFLPFSDAKRGPFSDLSLSGRKILETIGNGIEAAKDWFVGKVKSVFDKVREYLPFSDAKRGPFSDLTKSGGAIITTLAKGVGNENGTMQKAMTKSFSHTGVTPTVNTPKLPKMPTMGQADISPSLNMPNMPSVPGMHTTLDVATRFDGAAPPAYSGATWNQVNAAGAAPRNTGGGNGGGRTIKIEKLIDKLVIEDAGTKDPRALADEILQHLYEKLQAADEILGTADKGVLLND